jgi:Protein of unknown function (DUF2778)
MTFRNERRRDYAARDRARIARHSRPQRVLGGTAFVCVALASVWTLYVNLAGKDADQVDVVGTRGDKLVTVKRDPPARSDNYAFLFDPHAALGLAAGTFARSAPVQPSRQAAAASPPPQPAVQETQDIAPTSPSADRIAQSAAVPVPQLHPAQIRNAPVRVSADTNRTDPHAPADQTFFEKLFGKPAFEKLFGKPANVALAYAAPDDGGILARQNIAARYDRWTAVYDISAHKVYMPDGTQLEAHSGLGSRLDDPRYAAEKDYGVTPPATYDLAPRETLFHGVRALRLVPEDEGKVFGRSGFLAHSFMLGPNGDSNGCVSFRNYDAFLQAYDNQQVKRLVVVTRLD